MTAAELASYSLIGTATLVALVVVVSTVWAFAAFLRHDVWPALVASRRWLRARRAERQAWRWHQAAARRREMLKPRDGGRPW